MKLILITPPTPHPHEIEILNAAYDIGINRIHIRKPAIAEELLKTYLENLEEKLIQISALHYYENLVRKYLIPIFHFSNIPQKKILDEYNNISNKYSFKISTSFHHPSAIATEGQYFDYAFCSPVFPSISKKGYEPSLNWDLNSNHFPKKEKPELIALGGIDSSKIEDCKNRGFDGVATLGNIWNQKTKHKSIIELEKMKTECDRLS